MPKQQVLARQLTYCRHGRSHEQPTLSATLPLPVRSLPTLLASRPSCLAPDLAWLAASLGPPGRAETSDSGPEPRCVDVVLSAVRCRFLSASKPDARASLPIFLATCGCHAEVLEDDLHESITAAHSHQVLHVESIGEATHAGTQNNRSVCPTHPVADGLRDVAALQVLAKALGGAAEVSRPLHVLGGERQVAQVRRIALGLWMQDH